MKSRVSRREVLRIAAALGLAPVLPSLAGCGDSSTEGVEGLPDYEYDGPAGPSTLFQHGVASGDPLTDRVILWTRCSTDSEEVVDIYWEVALDPEFSRRVGAGWVSSDAERDFTVKLDAVGLAAGTTYYYRFRALGRTSPIGRTRTAPSGSPDRLRMGVASCSRYTGGYFHAYRGLADKADLDLVVHLGDYIYEDGNAGPLRPHDPPRELSTLEDYRTRYAQYRLDADLQEMHRQHPFVCVWDDHESANNAWKDGAANHDEETEGSWAERRARAERVYSEWMPLRDQPGGMIFRHLRFGDLVDLLMLDTRLWGRDRPADSPGDRDVIRDPGRTMLGRDQEQWFADRVRDSTARWIVLGQQVIFSPWKTIGAPESEGGGQILNQDAWDGYFACRARLLQALREAGNPNLAILTADIHSSWAFDVTDDPNDPEVYDPQTGAGAQGVEFVVPGVTSAFPVPAPAVVSAIQAVNPHLAWGEVTQRGYMVVDVDRQRIETTWYHIDDVTAVEAEHRIGAVFATRHGANHLEELQEPAPPPPRGAAPAPRS